MELETWLWLQARERRANGKGQVGATTSVRAKGNRHWPGWSLKLNPGHKQENEGHMAKARLVLETSGSQLSQKMRIGYEPMDKRQTRLLLPGQMAKAKLVLETCAEVRHGLQLSTGHKHKGKKQQAKARLLLETWPRPQARE